MSSTSDGAAGGSSRPNLSSSNKDVAIAKQMRDRRRREPRGLPTPDNSNNNNNAPLQSSSNRDLLNQSHELSTQTLQALQMAQRKSTTTNAVTTSLASRRLPNAVAEPFRRPAPPPLPQPLVPLQQQQQQQTRQSVSVQQEQQQQHQPRRSLISSVAPPQESSTPAAPSLLAIAERHKQPRTTSQQQQQQRAERPLVMASVTTNRSRPFAVVPKQQQQQQDEPRQQQQQQQASVDKIVTLDDTLHQYLAQQGQLFVQQPQQYNDVLTAGARLRLRMMDGLPSSLSSSSCPQVLGTTIHNNQSNTTTATPVLVQAWRVAEATTIADDIVLDFVLNHNAVRDKARPYHPMLCYGNTVTLESVLATTTTTTTTTTTSKNSRNTSQESLYLQVTEASGPKSTLAEEARVWDVVVGPVTTNPDMVQSHVWTVLPHVWLDHKKSQEKAPPPPLKVGVAAIESRLPSCTVPVRQGMPVVLRNVRTGGLLSLNEHGALHLVTDALTSPGNVHVYYEQQSSSSSVVVVAPTMDRLQRNDIMYPTAQQAVWFHASAGFPLSLPCWEFQHRIALHGDYLAHPHRHKRNNDTTAGSAVNDAFRLGLDDQAKALVDHLLGSMMGLESSLVHVRPLQRNPQALAIQGCDRSLTQLASNLVRLSNNYVAVRSFVAAHYPGYAHGLVRQALGAALDNFLQEYLAHVSTVQRQYRQNPQEMGIQKLDVLMQPSCECLGILDHVARVAENYKGGALLNALQTLRNESYRGDLVGQEVLDRLLGETSRPYLTMLQQWLEDGALNDPHEEFMVQSLLDANEWHDCFLLRVEHVLQGYFSTRPTLDQVLPTGRYWQALQSCRMNHTKTKSHGDFTLTYHANPVQVASYVKKQYLDASQQLCTLLLEDFDLMGTLRLIKRYYLLDQGDFFVNFMDSAEKDIYLARDKVSLGRLQHWLSLSVQLTEHKSDEAWVASPSRMPEELKPSANEIRCKLAEYGLIDRLDRLHRETGGIDTSNPGTPQRRIYGSSDEFQPKGVEFFSIELPRIPSPLNLILSPRNMNDYQLLFRTLFFAKHVERRLVSVWRDHSTFRELPSIRGSMGRTFLLRQNMLHCLQHLIYYMMFEVIEQNWTELETNIRGATSKSTQQTLDDILALHNRFLERTLEACLITSRELLSSLMRLMRTCLLFADQMKLFMKSISIHDDRQKLALEKQKRVQQGLHGYDTSPRNNQKVLRETLRQDYLDRQRRVLEHTRRVEREVTVSKYTRMIEKLGKEFNDQLREFMNLLSKSDDLYHTQKLNLCIILDYNGFASSTTK